MRRTPSQIWNWLFHIFKKLDKNFNMKKSKVIDIKKTQMELLEVKYNNWSEDIPPWQQQNIIYIRKNVNEFKDIAIETIQDDIEIDQEQ